MRITSRTGPWALLLITLVAGACAGASAPGLSNDGRSIAGPVAADEAGTGVAAASAAAAAPEGPIGGSGNEVGAAVVDASIIRTGTIALEVSDVPGALRTARDGIRGLGGYIGASQTENGADRPLATITYRIPADRWEEALDLLRGLNGLTSRVVAERTDAVEVTGQVVDLEARIRNLESSETALQAIAIKALKISDVLEIQAQLTQVRGQIEQLTAQLQDLQDRAAFATLTASFQVPVIAVEVAQQDWNPGVVVDQASASLIDVLQALTTAGIWFAIVWLPVLLVLAVIVMAVIWLVRRLGFLGRPGTRGEVAPS